ncbi:hypothetical protein BJ993_004742 [Nocardioides aromaticivorans]|uniref:Aminoglycoside phosphotransferase domain-containing protein n=1 Tax=Nocardioides aromaticivorans TaxID=200618 RepID=A0A7Y9ZLH9_9ACTN|nr:hypothetical protein [Nocardioides aromaticivorans]NYI47662.1 hypothetical protein [Nocardioides aromaticivorans]
MELLETAAELWPGAEVVPAGRTGDDRPVRARYAVISRSQVPTVLVPVETSVAAGASLRRFSTASTWWESASRAAAGAAVRSAPALLRNRVEIRGGDDSLAQHLAEVLGTEVTFSISIGTARVNRKPVLQVFDTSGACRAFVKVGWSDSTVTDVVAEGEALARVGEHEFRHVVPPALLARTFWRGRPILTTGPLEPSAWSRRRRAWDPPERAMSELDEHFALDEVELAASPWWSSRWEAAGSIGDPVTRGRLEQAMEVVEAMAGERLVRFGAWHGDWTPWNMAFAGERVLLWDWERFEVGVPSGLDPLHYRVNVMNSGTPASAEGILWALTLAAYPDRSLGGEPHIRALLYLVEILCRYLRLSEVPEGEHISERAQHTLVALERLAGLA